MIPEVNISGKASVASINRAGGRGESASKEHTSWLKIDQNATKIIIVQDYKQTKNQCEWNYTIVLKLRVKQVIYESKLE